MRQANCVSCKNDLVIASEGRKKSGGFTGVCSPCKLTHTLVFAKDYTYYVLNVQRRFTSDSQVWHFVYRPKSNESSFILIERGRGIFYLGDNSAPRIEHKLQGFILPERFLKLMELI
jgi:hypothetical protein